MAHTEVLLVKPVEGLGGEGDQVKVRAGYARNFLLPRKIAVPLTGAQKSHLRALGQKVDAGLKVGRGRLTAEFFAELQKLLRAHELVKLRFLGADRVERAALCTQIADEGRCVCVGAVGHTALFYRQDPNPKARKVTLP